MENEDGCHYELAWRLGERVFLVEYFPLYLYSSQMPEEVAIVYYSITRPNVIISVLHVAKALFW